MDPDPTNLLIDLHSDSPPQSPTVIPTGALRSAPQLPQSLCLPTTATAAITKGEMTSTSAPTTKTTAIYGEWAQPTISKREAELMQDFARLDEALKERIKAEGKREAEVKEAWRRVDELLKLLEDQKNDHLRERERFEAVIETLGKQLEAAQSQVLMAAREIENNQMATTTLLTKLTALVAGLPNTLNPIEIQPSSPSAPPSSSSSVSAHPKSQPPKSQTPTPPALPCKPSFPKGKLIFSIPAGGIPSSSLAPLPPKPPLPAQPAWTPAWTPVVSSSSANKTTTKNNGKEQQERQAIDRDAISLPLEGMTSRQRKRIRRRVRDAKEEEVEKLVEEIWKEHGGMWAVKGKGKM